MNIARKFLEDTDRYLAGNWQDLKCSDIAKMYFELFTDLKKFKGNSHGFTGLSELLIFRILYHGLGGLFTPTENTPQLLDFTCTSNNKLRIGQSTRVNIDKNRRKHPDLVVYYCDKLIAVAQIKIYVTRGCPEVKREMATLEELKNIFPEMKALLLIYNRLPKKGNLIHLLQEEASKKRWFRFLALEDNPDFFWESLSDCLDLGRVTSASGNTA